MPEDQLVAPEVQEADLSWEKPIFRKHHEAGNHRPSSPLEELAAIWFAENVPTQEFRRALDLATEAFDDREKAMRWLQERNLQTGNRPPVSILGSPSGLQIVETVLGQIQYGIIG